MGTLLSSSKPIHATKEYVDVVMKAIKMKQPIIDRLNEHKDQAVLQAMTVHLLRAYEVLDNWERNNLIISCTTNSLVSGNNRTTLALVDSMYTTTDH